MVAVFVIVKLIQRTFLFSNGFVLKTVSALIVLIYASINFDLLSSIIHKIRETCFSRRNCVATQTFVHSLKKKLLNNRIPSYHDSASRDADNNEV